MNMVSEKFIEERMREQYSNFAKYNPKLTPESIEQSISDIIKGFRNTISKPKVEKIDVFIETTNRGERANGKITYVNGTVKPFKGYTAGGYGYDMTQNLFNRIINDKALQNLWSHDYDELKQNSNNGISFERVGLPAYFVTYVPSNRNQFNYVIKELEDNHYVILFTDVGGNSMSGRRTTTPHRRAAQKKRNPLPSEKSCPIKVNIRKML